MKKIEEFKSVINKLLKLGENAEELDFWMAIFPHLEKNDREKIYDAFFQELENLKKIGASGGN